MANRVLSGKGSVTDLENLHGKVTRVYSQAMDSLVDTMEYSDMQQAKYKEDVAKAEEAGEDTSEIIKPYPFVVDKDVLALLKNAQSFLKENDVQMDISKGTIGAKILRKNIQDQIEEKMRNQ